MITASKTELLQLLSSIEGLVFVGGTSEYIQGIKNTLRDTDIVVPIDTNLSNFGWVFKSKDEHCFLSKDRGVIITKNCYIDIFFTNNTINTISINGYTCQIVKDMINIQKKIIEYGYIKNGIHRHKVTTTINRLINYF